MLQRPFRFRVAFDDEHPLRAVPQSRELPLLNGLLHGWRCRVLRLSIYFASL
jgi:hypothetical protein